MAAGVIKKKEKKSVRACVDITCAICGNMKVNSLNMYMQHRAGLPPLFTLVIDTLTVETS